MQISSDSLQVDISRDCSQGHHDDCLSLIDGSHDTLIIKSSEGLELTIDTQQAHEILECLAQWFEYELVDKDEKLERKRVAFRQGAIRFHQSMIDEIPDYKELHGMKEWALLNSLLLRD